MPDSSRRLCRRWALGHWLGVRLLGLVLAMLVLPGVGGAVQEVVCAVVGIECCDGDCCSDGDWQSCPQSCLHCACCAHANVLPMAAAVRLEAGASLERVPLGRVIGAEVTGYRAPPFRPPLS